MPLKHDKKLAGDANRLRICSNIETGLAALGRAPKLRVVSASNGAVIKLDIATVKAPTKCVLNLFCAGLSFLG